MDNRRLVARGSSYRDVSFLSDRTNNAMHQVYRPRSDLGCLVLLFPFHCYLPRIVTHHGRPTLLLVCICHLVFSRAGANKDPTTKNIKCIHVRGTYFRHSPVEQVSMNPPASGPKPPALPLGASPRIWRRMRLTFAEKRYRIIRYAHDGQYSHLPSTQEISGSMSLLAMVNRP